MAGTSASVDPAMAAEKVISASLVKMEVIGTEVAARRGILSAAADVVMAGSSASVGLVAAEKKVISTLLVKMEVIARHRILSAASDVVVAGISASVDPAIAAEIVISSSSRDSICCCSCSGRALLFSLTSLWQWTDDVVH